MKYFWNKKFKIAFLYKSFSLYYVNWQYQWWTKVIKIKPFILCLFYPNISINWHLLFGYICTVFHLKLQIIFYSYNDSVLFCLHILKQWLRRIFCSKFDGGMERPKSPTLHLIAFLHPCFKVILPKQTSKLNI